MATNINIKLEKLNILQWNMQGLRAKAPELSSILSEKKKKKDFGSMSPGDSPWGLQLVLHEKVQTGKKPPHRWGTE